MIVGIIGGSGITAALLDAAAETVRVETEYGIAAVTRGAVAGQPAAFLARHGEGHAVLPHQVNYRAHALALQALGVTRILATSACGSLDAGLPPGSLALPTDFIDFTRARPWTLAPTIADWGCPRGPGTRRRWVAVLPMADCQDTDAEIHNPQSAVRFHVDMSEPYCAALRATLMEAAAEVALPLRDGATYLCVEGPRYETHAEIRMFQALGADLVGMTGVPEVTLARELGQCYATVAIVTNAAAGLAPETLSHEEVEARVAALRGRVTDLLRAAVPRVATLPACAAHGARVG